MLRECLAEISAARAEIGEKNMIKIAVDAMGGDNAPGEIVKGAVDAVAERNDIRVCLTGQTDVIEKELSK